MEDILHPVRHLCLGDGVSPGLGVVNDLLVPDPQNLVGVRNRAD